MGTPIWGDSAKRVLQLGKKGRVIIYITVASSETVLPYAILQFCIYNRTRTWLQKTRDLLVWFDHDNEEDIII